MYMTLYSEYRILAVNVFCIRQYLHLSMGFGYYDIAYTELSMNELKHKGSSKYMHFTHLQFYHDSD